MQREAIYLVERHHELALLYGLPDADAMICGPFACIDDAEQELQRRSRIAERKRTVRAVLAACLLVLLCGWAMPSLIGDERLQRRADAQAYNERTEGLR